MMPKFEMRIEKQFLNRKKKSDRENQVQTRRPYKPNQLTKPVSNNTRNTVAVLNTYQSNEHSPLPT